MKFQRLLKVVYTEPWIITPAVHATIRTIIDRHINGIKVELPTEDCAEECPMYKVGMVAVIPVNGVLGKGVSPIQKSSGVCDVVDIRKMLNDAVADDLVKQIMFHFDSPGGAVGGIAELATEIAACSKPTLAFTEDSCDSGAYWLASACDAICCTPTADIGGVGVYMPWEDCTKAYESEGVKVDVIRNKEGTYKGMGLPGTALTEAQRAHLQSRVDDIFTLFKAAVNSKRKVQDEALQGQSYLGINAKAVGLVDEVCGFKAAIANCANLKN